MNVPDAIDLFGAIGRHGMAMSSEGLLSCGLDCGNLIVLCIGTAVLAACDIYKYRPDENEPPRSVLAVLRKGPAVVFWAVFMLILLAVLIFGRYGLGYDAGSFIYARI